jgi:hypothetical protein
LGGLLLSALKFSDQTMPRRKGPKASSWAEKERFARWRYLIRHPDFRAELRAVSRLYDESSEEFSQQYEALLHKWDLQYIPGEMLALLPHLGQDSLEYFLGFLESYGAKIPPYRRPVESDDPLESPFLQLTVDLRYPIDLLVSLVEEEVRFWLTERSRRRRRPDKVEFYLRVYDLAEQGQTFGAIAKALKRRVSTVKSAFLAARRIIFGSAPATSKRQLPLVSFDAGNHCQQCSVCRTAQRFEDMCPQAQYYANQDYASQRERVGLNTLR